MKKRTMIASYLLLSIMIILTAITFKTGVSAQEKNKVKSGWLKQGRYYYYIDNSGKKTFGWKKLGGFLYYFNKKGQRVSGIQVVNSKYYEFDKNGVYRRFVGEASNKAGNSKQVSYTKTGVKNKGGSNNSVYDKQGNFLGQGKKYISNASAYTGDTTTASGQKPRWGTIAVDPKVIPLGSKVYVPYYDKVFIANDTGGIIRGTMIDIFMKSSLNMRNFGRRNIEIYVLEDDR